MAVLVTSSAGYLGIPICAELLNRNEEVMLVGGLSLRGAAFLNRVKKTPGKTFKHFPVRLLDRNAVEEIFQDHDIDMVIHAAAYESAGEWDAVPPENHRNHVFGTLMLCQTMQKYGVKRMVFSSSASVYALQAQGRISEQSPLGAYSASGRSQWMIEELLRDLHESDPGWGIALMRCFHPAGVVPEGRTGVIACGVPYNPMPYLAQAALGKLERLQVFGNDYPTPDGTMVRDYVHVKDLAKGHVRAMDKLRSDAGVEAYNLGSGKGYSVFEVIRAFEKVSGRKIPIQMAERRPGETAAHYADTSKALRELGWAAQQGIEDTCAEVWRWYSGHSNGYEYAEESVLKG